MFIYLFLLLFGIFLIYIPLPIFIKLIIKNKFLASMRKNKYICLTFDDGPNNYATIKVLELLKDFKIIFAEDYKVEDLEYKIIDTKDQKEEMEVYTWYKKAWILTANEIREKIGFPKIDWWDVLLTDNQSEIKDQVDEIFKKETKSFYKELTQIENDFKKGL